MFKTLGKKESRGKIQKVRLEADAVLTPADFKSIADRLGVQIFRARKIGYVAATKSNRSRTVETRWNGRETSNTARVGDWVVTNMSVEGEILRDKDGHVNTYVIKAKRFPSLYEPMGDSNSYGGVYRAKGVVSAIALPGGFDIVAPWGEREIAPAGYLILNGSEVYGCNLETFIATYEVMRSG